MTLNTKVTDPALISQLTKANIGISDVKFARDYCAESPYSKLYVNERDKSMIQVISGLPMARVTDGTKLVPGWETAVNGRFRLKNNLFEGYAEADRLILSAVNDQQGGFISGKECTWGVSLYSGLEKIERKSTTILPVDPTNENYTDNVLEMDYGICKRRVRLIEGRIIGTWIFSQNPKVDITIKYENTGRLPFRLGQYAVKGKLQEFIPRKVFDAEKYPLEIRDTGTFYPDADPESTSVDGWVQHAVESPYSDWNGLTGGAGTQAYDSGTDTFLMHIGSGNAQDKWYVLRRGILLFNTGSIPANALISAGVLSVYYQDKVDNLNIIPNTAVYSSAPASNTTLAAGDYDSLGNTDFSNVKAYADFGAGYNDYTLNAAGRAAITKEGITKFGFRNKNYDVANSAPTWTTNVYSYIKSYASEQGNGYKPKLVVTYTVPALAMGAQLINMNHFGITTFKAGNVRCN